MIQPIFKPVPLRNRGSEKCRPIGTLDQDAVTIFVHEKVLDGILDFSDEDLQKEIGGFLIGNLYLDGDGEKEFQYVEIEHFLPALEVKSRSASLTFTHETWSMANQEVNSRFSGQRIVGWHHTHPGLGVFLSAYDLFIHKNFFGSSWQVAMVVDPKRQEFAFFQWQQDQVNDCGFVYVPQAG
ncbi:MAG: hypothetical protein VX768_00970 [Planctomycetota bacterium]|nr:hypothetical protein [Planctomycetota bacterium]